MKPQVTTLAVEGPDGTVRLSPPIFIDNHLDVDPGNLAYLAPQGDGVYGLQPKLINPFSMGESMDPSSGVVFFSPPGRDQQDDFFGMLRILRIANNYRPVGDVGNVHYWAFEETSTTPGVDGYITQLRVIDRFGLRFLYKVIDEEGYENFPAQPLTLPEFLWSFMVSQVTEYGSGFGSPKLAGKFGGDGHFSQEALSFGFMIENAYHHVYRIWSRAWLCNK